MWHEWAGDCDLGDGQLQVLYKAYMKHRSFCQGLGLNDRKHNVKQDLCNIVSDLDKDMNFLETGEKDAMKQYMGKLDTCNASEDKLFALAWECDGFKKLIDMNKELKSTACSLQTRLSVTDRSTNIPKESQLCQSLLKYVQSLYSKK